MSLRLTCYGGAEIVTGSNFMVEGSQGGRILVDCGLEQGSDFVEKEMWSPFPYDASKVDAVVVTHAHLDHVGRLPKLIKEGFKGKAYMTPPTKDLAELIMRDSVNILGETARKHNLPPLYTDDDVTEFMKHVETLAYHEEREVAPGLSVYLRNTGHILGSASVRVKDADGTTLALTGDIGNSPSPYLPDWEPIPDADAILMESVYGDRVNTDKRDRVALLRDAMRKAIAQNGVILIPAFSMERTQLFLYELSKMMESGELPQIPVYLDSPLAIKVTEVYEKWGSEYFKPEAEDELKQRHDLFKFPFLTMTPTREDSEGILAAPNPKIIMAGAGMSHGGRIGRWEQKYLPDPSTTLFIVGYQAPGSPGRLLQDGAPTLRLGGHEVRIRAKIQTFVGWSAHADRDELLDFAHKAQPIEDGSAAQGTEAAAGGQTKNFFIALGEPASARFFAQRIHDYLGGSAIVPVQGESFEISKDKVKRFSHG
ncbi:MAG: MBL fold metallo-hydrolase [Candidatus Pacebacteria bacterium]|nr:MBL fold metallo-hydrolase [Candidatus Paceibacterota bacterium]